MSVAGNLADLTLTELLQTIALSRKSGVLEICSTDEVAWLGLREGGIVRVAVSDREVTRELALKAAGVSPDAPSDEIEACLWEAAVNCILALFEWREGDFTFEPDEDPNEIWRGPEGLTLPTSLSPEFLALEGARLEDEIEDDDEPFTFGSPGEFPEPESPAPAPESTVDDDSEDDTPAGPVLRRSPELVEPAILRSEGAATAPSVPLIAIEGNRDVLDAIRGAFEGHPALHVFQHAELGMERLKHYLVRGQQPTLVIGDGVAPVGGGGDWKALVAQVRRLAPGSRLIVLSARQLADPAPADVALVRGTGKAGCDRLVEQLVEALGLDA